MQWSMVWCQYPWKQVNYNSHGCLSGDQDFLDQEHNRKALNSEVATEAYRVDLYGTKSNCYYLIWGAWSPWLPGLSPKFWMTIYDSHTWSGGQFWGIISGMTVYLCISLYDVISLTLSKILFLLQEDLPISTHRACVVWYHGCVGVTIKLPTTGFILCKYICV